MVSSRVVPGARVLAVALFALCACGCFEYNEVITLNRDGTGTATISGWIDANVAESLYSGEEGRQVMPPVTEGIARDMSVGSEDVRVASFSCTLESGRWHYDVTIEFANLDALSDTVFFRQREMSLTYVTAKQTRFRCYIRPSLLQMARERAEKYTDNPYSEKLLAAIDSDDFKKAVADVPMTYKIVLPGVKISGNAARTDSDPSGDAVSAVWEYRLGDILTPDKAPRFELTMDLPEIQVYRIIVIVVLLLSLIGVLVPAIRLVILKLQGVS